MNPWLIAALAAGLLYAVTRPSGAPGPIVTQPPVIDVVRNASAVWGVAAAQLAALGFGPVSATDLASMTRASQAFVAAYRTPYAERVASLRAHGVERAEDVALVQLVDESYRRRFAPQTFGPSAVRS